MPRRDWLCPYATFISHDIFLASPHKQNGVAVKPPFTLCDLCHRFKGTCRQQIACLE